MDNNDEQAVREREKLWQLLLHLEKIINTRTNYFLIAESIFMAAYVSVNRSFGELIFVIGAVILSVIWLFLQHQTFRNIGKLLTQIDGWFPEYDKWKGEREHPIRSNEVIVYALPGLFFLLWLIVGASLLNLVELRSLFQNG